MTLLRILTDRIAATGPITVADYMFEALLHPVHGYYTTRDPLGTAGDFTTAPEISQMFGELIGLSLAQSWLDQGAPAAFTLAELGPGRGTLMADILRATARVTGFHNAMRITLVEVSPALCDIQARTLQGHTPQWQDNIHDLSEQPLFLVANEFFDALPVHQYQRDGDRWRERMVGIDGDRLQMGLGPATLQPALAHRLEDTRQDDIVEVCPTAPPIIDTISTRIRDHGGAALIIDYGDWRSLGDTLQAIKDHAATDPLAAPGTADLTTHVDFEVLTQAARCPFTRITPQGVFLERLGITQRAQTLAQTLRDAPLEAHIAAHRRLTHPAEMGNLFKVLGLYPEGATPPPGLEP
ncbi:MULTISPECIES: class I SAM-dependent methyltransferase [Roseobacteraceae]|uniref:Putative S-adenosyl-L-methionine-dependent methyltransferase n=1 Tax=Pseudosulfitobacter pseudonitzschiae TaxID=1402135 RepID=A0A221K2W4_9RHOB|nr:MULTISPECIES: SAM-dependent methyltransferase [Roseobacteraceae]ASM73177.1 putative S-adenosyl-L-methionine-dependent methyltransferase [Pseudosulfitobacter pseudonitzschiae]